jgi:hypothetical protein
MTSINEAKARLLRVFVSEKRFFDEKYYLKVNRDVAESGFDPFAHFMRFGWSEGRNPSESFDNLFYLAIRNLSFETNALTHAVDNPRGRSRGLKPSSEDEIVAFQIEKIRPFVDASFYRQRYGLGDHVDAADHYLRAGWKLSHDPSPHFSTRQHLDALPFVRHVSASPLFHRLVIRPEGLRRAERAPSPAGPARKPSIAPAGSAARSANWTPPAERIAAPAPPSPAPAVFHHGAKVLKIRVIGNCQSEGIAMCMQAMLPALDVSHQQVHSTSLLGELSEFDIVYAQAHLIEAAEQRGGKDVRVFPRVTFPAFQPDEVYVRSGENRIRSALGMCHSALVIQGYLHGLSPEQTEKLFCRNIFERVGYFDYWDRSVRALVQEGRASRIEIGPLIEKWRADGCFMHLGVHAKIAVLGDVAKAVLRRDGFVIATESPHQIVPDVLLDLGIWPVYPELAERLGVEGGYTFVAGRRMPPANKPFKHCLLTEFIKSSFEIYSKYPKDSFSHPRMNDPRYADLRSVAMKPRAAKSHPYKDLQPYQYWRRSFEGVAAEDVDPVVRPDFQIGPSHKVATGGSCFAQHIAHELQSAGFTYYVAETPASTMTKDEAKKHNYGVFSARYGNLYTTRQLDQLLQRALGDRLLEHIVWRRSDGAFVDPFRPEIEPEGFPTAEQMLQSRRDHLAAVRDMTRQMDVFVFTLGLTEAWRRKDDGYVLPLAPGVVAGEMDPDRYEFVNFDANEVEADLASAVQRIRSVNPGCSLIFTVSPVPLVATYEDRHVLVSTTYSKSALRVAAERVAKVTPKAAYFPSYEIVTGGFARGRYFADDLRSVTPAGVAHVMRLFLRHYAAAEKEPALDREIQELIEMVCEEERLDAALAAP